MAEVQQVRMLNLQIQDDEIDTFASLITKLMVASKQTGFKKPFNEWERALIESISEQLGLSKTEECSIDISKTDKTY